MANSNLDELFRNIKNEINDREFNLKFILKDVFRQIICEKGGKDYQARWEAADVIIDEVFNSIRIKGPEGEEYPVLDESSRFKGAMKFLKKGGLYGSLCESDCGNKRGMA